MPDDSTQTLASPPQRKRRNRRGEQTRKQILETAVSCLHKLGYTATTIEAVMSASGLSRGSVLNQFPTRNHLMAATAERAIREMIDKGSQGFSSGGTTRDLLNQSFDVSWAIHNSPAGFAVSELLLASRWDEELARDIAPMIAKIEDEVTEVHVRLARRIGVDDEATFALHGRLLSSNMRGLTIEGMFNPNREVIPPMLKILRREYLESCARLLGRDI